MPGPDIAIAVIKSWILIQIAAFLILFLLIVTVAAGQIPRDAEKYRRDLIRESRLVWGLNAPVATFAAQIETESRFNPTAKSSAGALGLSQFMPATAVWLAGLYSTLGPSDPLNPQWAMRALARYDRHLWERMYGRTDCQKMGKTLSSYNGGEQGVIRDEALAESRGLDPYLWFGNVESVNSSKSGRNWLENRNYVTQILLSREKNYVKAGWGTGLCVDEFRSPKGIS